MFRAPALLVLGLCIAGCGGESNSTAPANATAPAAAVENTTGEAAAAAPQNKPVALDANGLSVLADGTTKLLAFGTPMTDVLAELAVAVAGKASEPTTKDGCTTYSWEAGRHEILSLFARDGKFVGFEGGPGYGMANEIGFGSTRAELDAALDPKYGAPDEMGQIPFTVNGLRGLVEADGPEAGVVLLEAGTKCPAEA